MLIDERVFTFEYDGKIWRLELWKGNYNTDIGLGGGEIGLYYKDKNSNSSFYNSVGENDMLNMSMTIRTKNNICFIVSEKNTWWLTGFQLFNPYVSGELIMDAKIIFKTAEMRNAFKSEFNSMNADEKRGVTISDNGETGINLTWAY